MRLHSLMFAALGSAMLLATGAPSYAQDWRHDDQHEQYRPQHDEHAQDRRGHADWQHGDQDRRDWARRGDNDHDWNRGYYAPPVVVSPPAYGAYYAPPPVAYGPGISIGINIP